MLLEKGAKPDFRPEFGCFAGTSLLSFAKEKGFEDVVMLLQSYA